MTNGTSPLPKHTLSVNQHSVLLSVMDDREEAPNSGEQSAFASLQEECNYFRAQYESTVQKVEDIQAESQTLDELIETLNGLNQGLEESNDALEQKHREDQQDIQVLEKQVQHLEAQLADCKEELALLKQRRADEAREHNANVSSMQRKIENLEKEVDDRKQAIVKLEMGNDDLERSQRNALSSILDLESKHNRLLEEKILLEEDLLGKDRLQEELQRLKDELRDQTLETAFLKTQLEKTQAEIAKLRLDLPHSNPSPAIRITKSQSVVSLSTPPTAVAHHTFMSPVAERSMEESPDSSVWTNSTIKTVPWGSPSQIPVARLKRLEGLSETSSPGSPSLRRSNTLDSISRNSPSSNRSPLSLSRSGNASNLNRSTNFRNIASLASADSPARARSTAIHRHTSSSTPIRPLATRKGSDTNSIHAEKRQEIISTTANLVARLQGFSAARKTVVRKTSGGFHRVATGVASAISHGNHMLARSVSQQSDQSDQQTGHPVPGVAQGDISTLSTNSPGSWVIVKDHSTERNEEPIKSIDHGIANHGLFGNTTNDSSKSLSISVNRSLKTTLPARPGIPSPLHQSVAQKTPSEYNVAVTRRNLRGPSAASNMTVTSSSTSESNRSVTPRGDPIMRVHLRPDSRLSQRDTKGEEGPAPVDKPIKGGETSTKYPASSNRPSVRLSGPHLRSREDGHSGALQQTDDIDHLPMIAPPPSRNHGTSGARASHRRIDPPASRSNVLEQAELPPRSSSVQGHHQVPTATRPISKRQKTPPPGVAAGAGVTTTNSSGIPRRSVSGRRPMSMSMMPQEVPPLPIGALAHIEAGRRAAGIGMGFPSSSRRTGA